jgi:hypothetical protein
LTPDTDQIPVIEAKLLKSIRIEPEDDTRIQAIVRQEQSQAALVNQDPPSEAAVIRKALRLGVAQLERERTK